MKRTEGNVPFRGFQTWYRVVGEREDEGKLPLLLLHGGPGATHDYLEPLEGMAETGRRAIFYDQLGCGKSDLPDDPSLWTTELFVDEVGAMREALGLERVHVFGNSWGGMLALEYALTRPAGLVSLVLTGEHDEATPAINRTVADGIPGAESVVLPDASHMAHVEWTDDYLRLLDDFLSRVEASAAVETAAGP